MNSVTRSKVAMFALGVASVVLIGSIVPAAASKGGKQAAAPAAFIPKPDIRDHRPKPVVRDHINGTVVRDHTGGSVPVKESNRRPRGKTPCLGNLCNKKVCVASVCF